MAVENPMLSTISKRPKAMPSHRRPRRLAHSALSASRPVREARTTAMTLPSENTGKATNTRTWPRLRMSPSGGVGLSEWRSRRSAL